MEFTFWRRPGYRIVYCKIFFFCGMYKRKKKKAESLPREPRMTVPWKSNWRLKMTCEQRAKWRECLLNVWSDTHPLELREWKNSHLPYFIYLWTERDNGQRLWTTFISVVSSTFLNIRSTMDWLQNLGIRIKVLVSSFIDRCRKWDFYKHWASGNNRIRY